MKLGPSDSPKVEPCVSLTTTQADNEQFLPVWWKQQKGFLWALLPQALLEGSLQVIQEFPCHRHHQHPSWTVTFKPLPNIGQKQQLSGGGGEGVIFIGSWAYLCPLPCISHPCPQILPGSHPGAMTVALRMEEPLLCWCQSCLPGASGNFLGSTVILIHR